MVLLKTLSMIGLYALVGGSEAKLRVPSMKPAARAQPLGTGTFIAPRTASPPTSTINFNRVMSPSNQSIELWFEGSASFDLSVTTSSPVQQIVVFPAAGEAANGPYNQRLYLMNDNCTTLRTSVSDLNPSRYTVVMVTQDSYNMRQVTVTGTLVRKNAYSFPSKRTTNVNKNLAFEGNTTLLFSGGSTVSWSLSGTGAIAHYFAPRAFLDTAIGTGAGTPCTNYVYGYNRTSSEMTITGLDPATEYSLIVMNVSPSPITLTGSYSVADAGVETQEDKSAKSSSKATCFSSNSLLQLRDGSTRRMEELRVGDDILTVTAEGSLEFSPVVYLPHKRNKVFAGFVELLLEDGSLLKLTPDHLLPAAPCPQMNAAMAQLTHSAWPQLIPAAEVNATGFCALAVHHGTVTVRRVVSSSKVEDRGVYTAVTANPYLVVGGVVASPFAVNHRVPDTFYSLVRAAYKLSPTLTQSSLVKYAVDVAGVVADSALALNDYIALL